MMINITIRGKQDEYVGDVLFRVYNNQSDNPDPKKFFVFETCINQKIFDMGLESVAGRYSSVHPQGVRECLHQLLDKLKDHDVTVQLSNEWVDVPRPDGAFTNYTAWFNDLFTKSQREYKKE